MATGTLEERVLKLECTLQELLNQLAGQQKDEPVQKRGWRSIVGVYADSPEFDDVVRIGQEWRNADRPSNDEWSE